MKKGYLDDLSEWLDSHPKIKQGFRNSAKIAFLAVKDDVKTALDSGYPMLLIWKHMCATGKLNCSYRMFCAYVQRYIRQAADEDKKGNAADSAPPTETSAAEETAAVKTAKNDDSADSEKAELEPWEKKLKVAEEKIAAMKNKTPKDGIPKPTENKELAKEEILPVAKSDGQEQKKETEIDPMIPGRNGRKRCVKFERRTRLNHSNGIPPQ